MANNSQFFAPTTVYKHYFSPLLCLHFIYSKREKMMTQQFTVNNIMIIDNVKITIQDSGKFFSLTVLCKTTQMYLQLFFLGIC